MATRAERVGQKRPRKALRTLPAGRWFVILEELPNDLGVELSMLVRQVWLAASCSHDRWRKLFDNGDPEHVRERRREALAAITADCRADLLVLTELRSRTPSEIALACEMIAGWAHDSGFAQTAVHFAEAGAAIAWNDAHAAFVAARLNRLVGQSWRAEVFYSRAVRDAHRQQKWRDYIRARLGLGTLLLDLGHISAAAEHFRSAAVVAHDQGIEWLAAQTLHDIVGLHFQHGDVPAAVEVAWNAVGMYPLRNERYPIAVHDLVFLYTVQHQYRDVMPVLEALLDVPVAPQDQVLIAGTAARAAAGAGSTTLYHQAETRVLTAIEMHGHHADAVFVNLAFGARALGDWARAERYAREGIRRAILNDHRYVESVGTALLHEIVAECPAPLPAPPLEPRRARQLAELARTLRGWMPGNQSGPGTLGPV